MINFLLRSCYRIFCAFGMQPQKTWRALRGLPIFIANYCKFKCRADDSFRFGILHPCLSDRFSTAGVGSWGYFHQDLFVAQRVLANAPLRHVDIGSRIDGFVAHVATFREIEVIDIRPLQQHIDNVRFLQLDFMDEKAIPAAYCDSASSLHVIEHFGLGRYGDEIDFHGYKKAIANSYRLLKPGGTFYLSTLFGSQRIEFDAHRVFSLPYLLAIIQQYFVVEHFSYIDAGRLCKNVVIEEAIDELEKLSSSYRVGILELTKLK